MNGEVIPLPMLHRLLGRLREGPATRSELMAAGVLHSDQITQLRRQIRPAGWVIKGKRKRTLSAKFGLRCYQMVYWAQRANQPSPWRVSTMRTTLFAVFLLIASLPAFAANSSEVTLLPPGTCTAATPWAFTEYAYVMLTNGTTTTGHSQDIIIHRCFADLTACNASRTNVGTGVTFTQSVGSPAVGSGHHGRATSACYQEGK